MYSTDPYGALRIPEFRWFLAKRLSTTLGIQIMSVSVQYFMYDLTGDPLMLGLIGLSEAIPAIGISLYAGHLADKYRRRMLLTGFLGLLLLCALALCMLAFFRHDIPKSGLVLSLFGIIFFTGIARGFLGPTNFAFLPQLVDKSVLPNAITWESSSWQVASISGLGIGGVLYGVWNGPELAFISMTVLCLAALISILQIPNHPAPPADHTEPALARIREGLRFVFNNQLIIGSSILDLFAVLFGGAVALLPVFAKDILKVGPEGLGALRAAMSIGAVSMAFMLAHRPPGKGAGKWLFACVAGFGLCMIGFGLSQIFWVSFFCLLLAGMLDEVSVYIRSSLTQHLTPEHMKGRVASVNKMFITSSNEIGAFESGLAASLMGTAPSVIFGGVMTLLVVGVTAWMFPALRRLDFREILKEQPVRQD